MPINLNQLQDAYGNQEFVNAGNTNIVQTAGGLFGKYVDPTNPTNSSSATSSDQLAALNSMWASYRTALFPELNTANTFDTSGASTNFLDATDKKNVMVGYMFAASLRDFFYNWLPDKQVASLSALGNNPTAIANGLQTYFQTYLADGTASLYGKRQNFSGMWVILILIQMMQDMQNTAPNKASTALIYAQGQQTAAMNGSEVAFYQQASANDFATQKKNQDAQKNAETYRNWNTLVGQFTSDYQTQAQTSNDSYSQLQQLISSTLEQFQSLIQNIIKS